MRELRLAAQRRTHRRPSLLEHATPATAARLALLALRLGITGPPRSPAEEARLSGALHTRLRDRQAIAHHYDLGNRFYQLFLDPGMAYSCAYWTSPSTTDYDIADAQRDKLDLICAKLGLKRGLPVRSAELEVSTCDMSSLGDVRGLAAELSGRRLDILVHNAGALPAERATTADGARAHPCDACTRTAATHRVAAPALAASPEPRVILVSSGGMYTQHLHAEDPEYQRGTYRGATAYARTKRMQVALLPTLAQRYAPEGITVHAMHPGWAGHLAWPDRCRGFIGCCGPFCAARNKAATTVWLATTRSALPSARFWHDRRQRPEHYLPMTRDTAAARERLWRAYQLKEALREVFSADFDAAAVSHLLDRWCSRAQRSRIPEFVKAARTIRTHRAGIDAAIERGLSRTRAHPC